MSCSLPRIGINVEVARAFQVSLDRLIGFQYLLHAISSFKSSYSEVSPGDILKVAHEYIVYHRAASSAQQRYMLTENRSAMAETNLETTPVDSSTIPRAVSCTTASPRFFESRVLTA